MKPALTFPLIALSLLAAFGCTGDETPRAEPVIRTTDFKGVQPTVAPNVFATSQILENTPERVALLALSPDGTLLATAASDSSDLGINLLKSNGQLVRSLSGHTARVLSLGWRPDGKLLASGAADQTIRFWNTDGTP